MACLGVALSTRSDLVMVGDSDGFIIFREVVYGNCTLKPVLRVKSESHLETFGNLFEAQGGYDPFVIEFLGIREDLPCQICPGLPCRPDVVEYGSHGVFSFGYTSPRSANEV